MQANSSPMTPPADDDEPRRDGLDVERFRAGDHTRQISPFDRRFGRDRTGRKDDMPRCDFLAAAGSQINRERVRPRQSRRTSYQLHAPGSQQLLDAADELINDGLLIAHQAGQIHGCIGE